MEKNNPDIIPTAGLTIFTLISTYMGNLVINKYPETPYIGLSIMVLSILLFYSSIHFFRKKKDEERIVKLESKLDELEKKMEKIEDLINIKSDIKLLKRVCKIR